MSRWLSVLSVSYSIKIIHIHHPNTCNYIQTILYYTIFLFIPTFVPWWLYLNEHVPQTYSTVGECSKKYFCFLDFVFLNDGHVDRKYIQTLSRTPMCCLYNAASAISTSPLFREKWLLYCTIIPVRHPSDCGAARVK